MAGPAVNKPQEVGPYQYLPFRQRYRPPTRHKYFTTFGVEVLDARGRRVMRIKDVSDDMALIVRMTYLCTKEQLEPIHLREVIDNFLGEY